MSLAETTALPLAAAASPEELLSAAAKRWGNSLILITSFQAEGMAILDMSHRMGLSLRVWTIDTGRLPEETHAFMAQVQRHYGISISVAAPAWEEIAALLAARGANSFYNSTLDRQLCCEIRKARVLDRLLGAAGAPGFSPPAPGAGPQAPSPSAQPSIRAVSAWITGLRRDQSPARRQVQPVAADLRHPGLWRLAPLAAWTDAQLEDYTRRHGVPRHPLYSRGFTSIGCTPCTRSTAAGESPRAGRWWWEQEGKKECGLHDAARFPGFDGALASVLNLSTGEPLAS